MHYLCYNVQLCLPDMSIQQLVAEKQIIEYYR